MPSQVCKWLSSPLRETESFPHFAPIDQNRAQANSNSRARAGGEQAQEPLMVVSWCLWRKIVGAQAQRQRAARQNPSLTVAACLPCPHDSSGARPASPPMLPSNTPDLRATAAALTTQRLVRNQSRS